ncbi:S-adenosyl-L-methionine-dependent methyltransferases superfamily protein [Hibiscus syriacus]|uniref:S-adenosyl-L-methionine-dependent methyltransferases superfamily protein n=1 Tax=Hibiscus syriacus TaxID=106335 RepID=A0A6A2WE78_HIBSY|nr:S-adenosyl-L-methionine-dependent methyltransferases superfamily protein [Hibiscus syriacus]
MSPALNKKDLQRIFEKLDENGDGFVSVEELNWLLDPQFSLDEMESIVGKPCLNFDEFLSFYDSISNKNIIEEEEEEEDSDLAKAFKVFDLNGDGFISCEELEIFLGRLGMWDENSGKDCRCMIRFYGTNFDGLVDFQEFKTMMLSTPRFVSGN